MPVEVRSSPNRLTYRPHRTFPIVWFLDDRSAPLELAIDEGLLSRRNLAMANPSAFSARLRRSIRTAHGSGPSRDSEIDGASTAMNY
jgi:hypothetical protein